MRKVEWIEVWIDSGSKDDFLYVLVLRALDDGVLELVDPQRKAATIESFNSYAEACHWLNADEYELVEGRWRQE